jgi:hypothetical protein
MISHLIRRECSTKTLFNVVVNKRFVVMKKEEVYTGPPGIIEMVTATARVLAYGVYYGFYGLYYTTAWMGALYAMTWESILAEARAHPIRVASLWIAAVVTCSFASILCFRGIRRFAFPLIMLIVGTILFIGTCVLVPLALVGTDVFTSNIPEAFASDIPAG